ncbi:MAG: response regulator transcription factor [Saprospirales bacterium]|nr:response regulator transcription factor [Saprospirales bacterium]
MKPIKAILVDDEKHCLDTLSRDLARHCPEVQIEATFDNPEPALAWLREHTPDVVFLDVVMPQMTGFQLLEQLPAHSFDVIFTTAYSEYAVQALRVSAVDYLQKPIDKDELREALSRIQQKERNGIPKLQFEALLHNLEQANHIKRIGLPTRLGYDFIQTADMRYFEADGNYAYVFLQGSDKLFVSRSLKELETMLADFSFCRIHHSFLVNLGHVSRYIRGDGGEVEMSNGSVLPVSRNRKEHFLSRWII